MRRTTAQLRKELYFIISFIVLSLFVISPLSGVEKDNLRLSISTTVSNPQKTQKIIHVTRKLLSDSDLLTNCSNDPKTPIPISEAKRFIDRGGVAFVENKGQIIDTKGNLRPDLKYVANANGAKLYFRNDGVSYVFSKTDGHKQRGLRKHSVNDPTALTREQAPATISTYRMDMNLVGSNPNVRVYADGVREGVSNYYLAHCPNGILGVKEYSRIVYENVYDKIDLEYFTTEGKMKYNFVVKVGGDVSKIQMRYDGASSVDVTDDGKLKVKAPIGVVEEQAPMTYQIGTVLTGSSDNRVMVRSGFQKHGSEIGFVIADYDRSKPLTIDPWATYYGGIDDDYAWAMAIDKDDNILITGGTHSSDFPVVIAIQDSLAGKVDAFVVKFDNDGVRLWATYYGGTFEDQAYSITTDANNSVLLTGETQSLNFPLKKWSDSAYYQTYAGSGDAFIVKLDSNGALQWATCYGGSFFDVGEGITLDNKSNILFTGYTGSSDLPVLNAYQSAFAGGYVDAFIAKFSSDGVRDWSTYYGGKDAQDEGYSIATDINGDIVVEGETYSSDFPIFKSNNNTYCQSNNYPKDIFILKLDKDCHIKWATCYGGTNLDTPVRGGIAIDKNNSIYITGTTDSDDFPVISKGGSAFYQNTRKGSPDAFILQFDSVGTRKWATHYGAYNPPFTGIISGACIKTDYDNNITLVINTTSDNMSRLSNGHDYNQPSRAGDYDMFIVRFDSSGTQQWATYYGGKQRDVGVGIVADTKGNLIAAGFTSSNDLPLINNNGFQNYNAGKDDAFIVKFGCTVTQPVIISTQGKTAFCEGGSIELDAGAGYQSYQWSNGASTQKINVDKSGPYSVTVTDTSGCSGTSQPVTVTVFPLPKPVITPSGSTVLCEGDSVVLDAGANFKSYLWSNNATTQTIKVKTAGSYSVNATDANGCTGTSPILAVSVYPKPAQPTITLTLSSDSLISSSASGYQWYKNDVLIPGATQQKIKVQGDGKYKVIITDQNGCKAESSFDVNITSPVSMTVGLACISNNTFNAGERVMIPLVINSSTNLKGSPTKYEAQIRFNRSILSPQFSFQSSTIEGIDRVVTLSSTRLITVTQGTLIELPFTIMLGDAPCTSVHLDTLIWTDGQASVTLSPQNQDCEICVNVCREGGTRLYHETGKLGLFQNRPNPFNAATVIEYEVIENAPTRLVVMDMLGRTVATLVDGVVLPGRYAMSFDASSLSSGTYVTVLQTPTVTMFRMMEVLK